MIGNAAFWAMRDDRRSCQQSMSSNTQLRQYTPEHDN